MNKDIDYALVESTRPPVYTAMKYWGKKPHNIWSEYIKSYVKSDGVVLDPFSGSVVSGIEALKLGKKTVNFDINPLSTFLIDTFLTDFDQEEFENKVKEIVGKVADNVVYRQFFLTECANCDNKNATIQHFKWEDKKIYEYGVVCDVCGLRYIEEDVDKINILTENMSNIEFSNWIPEKVFQSSASFSKAFVKGIGGNTYDKIWTERNLFILSEIFSLIINGNMHDGLKNQLLFGFIQSLHLSSKMCVPRNRSAKRDFSTSWGRPAYLFAKRRMEMNPLLLFRNNCIGKQSVESAMLDFKKSVKKEIIAINVNENYVKQTPADYDILYGIVDVKNIDLYLPDNSIDFIITDPPYGGLVQYLDLSQIWLVWLEKYNTKYVSDFGAEITVKTGSKSIKEFNIDFISALKKLKKVLRDDGKIVFTFHNKNFEIWNAFLNAITESGFVIEKVIHQPNKRTGEANVSDPYGTSASDFYIRCIKKKEGLINLEAHKDFTDYIVETAIKIINARNEPTPYQILFNGLLAEYSSIASTLVGFDENIKNILSEKKDIFLISNSQDAAGNLWWLTKKYITNDAIPLHTRVEMCINKIHMTNMNASYDEVLEVIFKQFPNGLTPDVKLIKKLYKKFFSIKRRA